VPTSWPMAPLRDVLRPVSRPEQVDAHTTYRILGAHWYAAGLYTKDVKSGSLIQADKVYRVEQGDFVYNRLFAWKGSFAVATVENDGCYVSNEFPCFVVDEQQLDGRYLYRYFSRQSTWEQALGLSSGSTPTSRNRLKEDKLLAMEIPLPPLDEQQRIVARIEELAAKIEEARELRQQAMKQVDSLITSLHLAASGERLVKLDEVLSLDEDQQQVMLGIDYPQVGVRSFGLGLFPRETLTASQTRYKYFNRLYRGALVMSQVKGWEGAVAVCTDDLEGRYVSPEYRTFRCISDRLLPEYLAALVPTSWFWQQLKGLTRGVGARRERTRPEQFVQITIPLPDVNRQANMLAIFEQIRSLKQLETGTVAEFDALLPSILDRAFKERS